MKKSQQRNTLLNFFNKRPPASQSQLRDATNLIGKKAASGEDQVVVQEENAKKRKVDGSNLNGQCTKKPKENGVVTGENEFKLIDGELDKGNCELGLLNSDFTHPEPSVVKREGVHGHNGEPSKKSPKKCNSLSPRNKCSRTKSPVKTSPLKDVDSLLRDDMDFFDDDFEDFPLTSIPFSNSKDFRIDTVSRCSILEVDNVSGSERRIVLKKEVDQSSGECFLLFPWTSCQIQVGDVVSVSGVLKNDKWHVTQDCLFIIHTDLLLSGTDVVGSLFCLRKSVIESVFPKTEGDTTLMVIGSLLHELLQKALTSNVRKYEDLKLMYQELINDQSFLLKVFKENVNLEAVKEDIKGLIPRIHEFIQYYIFQCGNTLPDNWKGQISKVLDIEECVFAPSLGMKGRIDASLNVKIHNKTKMMPLELKTGKVTFSPEHRGQIILYCLLLSSLGKEVDSGLLLYIRDGSMKEIKASAHEKRDLLMLRNQLASGITDLKRSVAGPERELQFPPPIFNERVCSRCQSLTVCSSALRNNGLSSLSESHPLSRLAVESTSHLLDSHISYVFNWYQLLSVESDSDKFGKQYFWLRDPKDREEDGTCVSHLTIVSASPDKDRFETSFQKESGTIGNSIGIGAYVVVSSDDRFAIASGFVRSVTPSIIIISLERDLSGTSEVYHLDTLIGKQPYKIALASLGRLLENTPRSASLRETIIDRKVPSFSLKLSKKVKDIGRDLFDRLNPQQTRALLQALTADEYILIKGMPGTGKTTTMSALIQLLVRLGKSVLVSSFTHSAVDNILLTLIGKVDFLRLGATDKLNPLLHNYSEHVIVDKLVNPTMEELHNVYNSKSVVGVTCLGAGHFWLSRKTFDVCLVDESTQVNQPSILKPLFAAKKFILIGDPKQLKPLCTNPLAKEKGFAVSLFERLDRPAVTSILSLQYRMNKVIMDLANSLTYDGLLQCGSPEVANATLKYPKSPPEASRPCPPWLEKCLSTLLEDSAILVDAYCAPQADNTSNSLELDIVRVLLEEFLKRGVAAGTVGVIAPYRGQVALIKKMAVTISDEIEVNTVDQYQGRDKNVILYSCTRTTKAAGSDILGDWSRLNVAITRAKTKLIIIGNAKVLNNYSNFNKLMSSFPESNIVPYS